MKNLVLVILILMTLVASANNKTISTQDDSKENTSSNSLVEIKEQSNFSFEKLIASQNKTTKKLEWIAPSYAGLQLGMATQNDVIGILGEPMTQGHPVSEYESTKDRWMFTYKNINDFNGWINLTFDIRSKILKEVWIRNKEKELFTIERAIDIYGTDYFLRGIGKKICSSEKLTKIEYPFTIVYPEKGIYLWVREGNQVDDILYVAECP